MATQRHAGPKPGGILSAPRQDALWTKTRHCVPAGGRGGKKRHDGQFQREQGAVSKNARGRPMRLGSPPALGEKLGFQGNPGFPHNYSEGSSTAV
ncbi:hypothetical protein MTO96_020501 [Rhipicephalus appendiculatus]